MMNTRILELIKTPDHISESDLSLLEAEIQKYPYIQNIKALYLYGIHQFRSQDYPKVLSTTAAYTTDKKILYQFVNKKNIEAAHLQQLKEAEEKRIAEEESRKALVQKYIVQESLITKEEEAPKPVFINGERNRILFEGEENFMDEPSVKIDLESTLESGTLVTETPKNLNVSHETIPNLESTQEEVVTNTEETFIEEISAERNRLETSDIEEISTNATSTEEEKTVEETLISEENEEKVVDAVEVLESEVEEVEVEINRIDDTVVESDEVPTDEIVSEVEEEKHSEQEEIGIETVSVTTSEFEDPSALSFHGYEEFLPNVAVAPANTEEVTPTAQVAQDSGFDKYKSEMDRLIAEVEAKMKANKKPREIIEDVPSSEINFVETHDAPHIQAPVDDIAIEEKPSLSEEITPIKEELGDVDDKVEPIIVEPAIDAPSEWVPMNFVPNPPDAVISIEKNSQETTIVEKEDVLEEKQEEKSTTTATIVDVDDEIKQEEKTEERPVFTVSFLSDTGAIMPKQKDQKEEEIKVVDNPNTEPILASNVPSFITTWQSWLKIDRSQETSEEEKVTIEEIKTKAIEKFIETEPKISQLKDEVNFVVKEKSNDISHLMTETLASIYVMQRLYSKAIKGYEILKEKHPEKMDYFNEKIEEVKELRANNNFNNKS